MAGGGEALVSRPTRLVISQLCPLGRCLLIAEPQLPCDCGGDVLPSHF